MPPPMLRGGASGLTSVLRTVTQSPFPHSTVSSFVTLLPAFALYYSTLLYYQDFIGIQMSGHDPGRPEIFDFIVVGGGSAGSVVANRLSRHSSVLLLEAGGDPHPLISIPAMSIYLFNDPSTDWGHKTVPQKNACFGLKNRAALLPRGKVLGGSSSINYMLYMRGNPRDYDNWANLTGDSRWTYDSLIPFFKKLENYHGHYPDSEIHSTHGPAYVEKMRMAPGLKYWMEAAQELGYKETDPNAYQKQGFSPIDTTTRMGRRFSAYNAYLEPILQRENLRIYRYARVIKVHLDRQKHAYGLTYDRHGERKFVRARKEIIISGGSIESPKLLLLSGIGPKLDLNSVGLKCRLSLPVGKNLQDHVYTILGPFYIDRPESILSDRDLTPATLMDYVTNGRGALAFGGLSAAGFSSSSLNPEPDWPDLQYLMVGIGQYKGLGAELERSLGFRDGVLTKFFNVSRSRDSFSVNINVARPRSFGEIRLRSKDPYDRPIVDPRYLSHTADLRVILEGIKFMVNFFENTEAFGRIGARLSPNPFPSCRHLEFRSDPYWKCFVFHFTSTLFHQAGTCSMGKASNDTRAVVTPELRVKRARSLRVIDASIMPVIPNANTNVPAMMIGEVGSSLVRQYWADQYLVSDRFSYYFRRISAEEACFYSKMS